MKTIWEKQRAACKLHRLAENGNYAKSRRSFFRELRDYILDEIKDEMKEIDDARRL